MNETDGEAAMILIIDYGVGNVGAVANMLRKIGARARVGAEQADLAAADKLVLPGVGHFDHGMRRLHASGLVPALNDQVLGRGKPVLGICLGMQMMTRTSEEGQHPGLGWIDAATRRLPELPAVRVPHMGWNAVQPENRATLFARDDAEERFYFVHSYVVRAADPAIVAASCGHGITFAAAIEKDNIFGVQFHPEKSHRFGMALMRRFADL
jgi:glutamine amidotransferase